METQNSDLKHRRLSSLSEAKCFRRMEKSQQRLLIPLPLISEMFGGRISVLSARYETSYHQREDLSQLMMVFCLSRSWNVAIRRDHVTGKLVTFDPAHVNRALESRAIDLWRSARRNGRETPGVSGVALTRTQPYGDDRPIYLASLRDSLTPTEYQIVLCRVDPPIGVIQQAMIDLQAARRRQASGRLAMNTQTHKVADKHIANFLGVSPATVSRAIKKARDSILAAHPRDFE